MVYALIKSHITSREIIHRDLAARNVLISKDRIAKVSFKNAFFLPKFKQIRYLISECQSVPRAKKMQMSVNINCFRSGIISIQFIYCIIVLISFKSLNKISDGLLQRLLDSDLSAKKAMCKIFDSCSSSFFF